jgi:uncharacterized protein involved in response to NO
VSHHHLSTDGPRWAGEPFRLFFPLGILAGVAGVMLWPLFYWQMLTVWPGVAHPRLMIGGFGGAFVTGFLGTAWPRFLESRNLRAPEVLLLAALWLAACGCWLSARLSAGDALMASELTCLLLMLLRRVHRAGGMPPPGFLLAFLSVAAGAVILFRWAFPPATLTTWEYMFSRLFFWQGFLLLPLLGVGSYLFPRFFPEGGKHPGRAAVGASRPAFVSVAALRRKIGVLLPAVMVVASFAWEASGGIVEGNLLRALALAVWAGLALPALLMRRAASTRAVCLRVALGSIFVSFVARALWPQWPVAMQHLLFLSGFGLALLLVADRVSLGHNDLLETAPARSVFWRWLLWLLIIAAATRVTADTVPKVMISHYIYAALLWAIVSVWWWIRHRRAAVPNSAPEPGGIK